MIGSNISLNGRNWTGYAFAPNYTVAAYADLPAANNVAANTQYLVLSSDPFSLLTLFTRKLKGIYRSTGTSWEYMADFSYVMDDTQMIIYDNGDNTKQAQFEASGITTGTRRIIALLDRDITMGDVRNEGATTDNALTKFDGTTGKIVQNSNAVITDDNAIFNNDGSLDGFKVNNVKTASLAWTRSGTVTTITSTGHGLPVNQAIQIIDTDQPVPIPAGEYNVNTTPTADTFTITCVNSGATSGNITYATRIIDYQRINQWLNFFTKYFKMTLQTSYFGGDGYTQMNFIDGYFDNFPGSFNYNTFNPSNALNINITDAGFTLRNRLQISNGKTAFGFNSMSFKHDVLSTNTNINEHQRIISDGSSLTHTLPTIASTTIGTSYEIKNVNDTDCIIDGNGAETIDGIASITLSKNQAIVIVRSTSEWKIVSGHHFSRVYDDVRLLGSAGNISGANVPTYAVRANNCKMWRFGATTEELFSGDQASHRWDRLTIYPHIHWEPSVTGTYTGTWAMDSIWVNPTNGSVVTTTGNTTGAFNLTATAGQQYVTDLTPITLTAPGVSALMQFRLYLTSFTSGTAMWLWGWDYHAGFVRPGTVNISAYP